MNLFLTLTDAIVLLLLYASGWGIVAAQSEQQICFTVHLQPVLWEEFNFTSQEWKASDGELNFDLFNSVGDVIAVGSNSKTADISSITSHNICVSTNNNNSYNQLPCQYWFFRGNGRFRITTFQDNDEVVIEQSEVQYGNSTLIQMGECSHYCNNNQQLVFIGETKNAPTLYTNDNKIVDGESLYRFISAGDVNSKISVQENNNNHEDVTMSLMCIQSNECYKLVGSAVYVLTDQVGTIVEKGSTFDGYQTFVGDSGNCYSLCDEVPLLGDTLRGQQILLAVSSISGTEALKNVNSPQHKAACWLVWDDAQQHVASDGDDNSRSLFQRYILAVFYYTLGGSSWRRNYNFLTPQDECQWNSHNGLHYNGIYCDKYGNVVGIALRGNYLRGMIPNELSFLIDVQYLYLSDNLLSGSIPSQLSALQNLHHFELQRNTLIGSIPQSLGEIPALQVVDLEDNRLTGSIPSPFVGDMIIFRLNRNHINGTLPSEAIGNWSSLRHFFVSGTRVEGTIPEGLGNLRSLEVVYLENNFLSGSIPSKLLSLPRLKAVRLHENSLTGSIPSNIATDSPLETLRLHYNKLTGRVPPELSTLGNLQELLLHNNALTGDIQLYFFRQNILGSLQLQNNNITGSIPAELCNQVLDIKADCGTPVKVDCECCTCYGIFSARTRGLGAQPEELPCASGELILRLDNLLPGDLIEFEFFDSDVSKVEFVSLTAQSTSFSYSRCVSMTGCFRLRMIKMWNFLHDPWDMRVTVNDDNIVLDESVSEQYTDYYFGFSSSDGTMRKDACDDYSLCGTVIEANSARRELVDLLTQINDIQLFNTLPSSHHSAACRWVAYLEENDNNLSMYMLQYFYLAVFYYETNGVEWFNATSWVTNEPPCNWFGVECDKDNIVTSLSLSANNLFGGLSSELGELRGLEHVTLSNNDLSGVIPIEIGAKLQRLNQLDASYNCLTGSIPSEIGKLQVVVKIDLGHNRLTNELPTEIGDLKKIEVLNLFTNTLTGEIPNSISQATSLKVLNMSNNLFVGEANPTKTLVQLESLDLRDNYFTGSVPVGLLQKNLRVLDLSGNIFTGSIPPTIGEMSSLERLYIYNNQLTGNIPGDLSVLSSLQQVALSHNRIKGFVPPAMGRLENLTLLHLQVNMLEGTIDHFNYTIDDFITDCGGTFTLPAAVECATCSVCCNRQGDCLRRDSTWPGRIIESSVLVASGFVFIFAFVGCIALLLFLVLVNCFYKRESEFVFCREFQEGSTYKLLMTNSPAAWLLAGATLSIQCLLLWIFLEASDFTDSRSDWQFSLICPADNIDCIDAKHISWLAWFAFSCIMVTFLANDFFEGFKMMYESLILGSRKGVLAGFVVVFITIISILASTLYNRSTSMSDTDVLKDAAILLFLNDIDEKLYRLVESVCPSWMEERNKFIAKHIVKRSSNNLARVRSLYSKDSTFEAGTDDRDTTQEEQIHRTIYHVQTLEKEIGNIKKDQLNMEDQFDNLKNDHILMENKYKNEIDVHKKEIYLLKRDYRNLQSDHLKLQNDNKKLQKKQMSLEKDLFNLTEMFRVAQLESAGVSSRTVSLGVFSYASNEGITSFDDNESNSCESDLTSLTNGKWQ